AVGERGRQIVGGPQPVDPVREIAQDGPLGVGGGSGHPGSSRRSIGQSAGRRGKSAGRGLSYGLTGSFARVRFSCSSTNRSIEDVVERFSARANSDGRASMPAAVRAAGASLTSAATGRRPAPARP
ncbi:MAG: hypothetical protein JNJ76_06155, partial [Candidatus Competibacter sp.]|nr:hypothetical protein [Candidatus Competibacter sp.]